jgi:hypothetical protein
VEVADLERDDFGDIHVTRHAPTVDNAPARALIGLSSIRHGGVEPHGDRLYIGHWRDGQAVYYRVIGWHAERQALIVEREDDRG